MYLLLSNQSLLFIISIKFIDNDNPPLKFLNRVIIAMKLVYFERKSINL